MTQAVELRQRGLAWLVLLWHEQMLSRPRVLSMPRRLAHLGRPLARLLHALDQSLVKRLEAAVPSGSTPLSAFFSSTARGLVSAFYGALRS